MSGAVIEWVDLQGGRFEMGNPRGDGYPQDGEMPVHEVSLTPFTIGATTVTNSQFASFVEETDYTTEAEEFGWSFVFAMFLPEDFEPTRVLKATLPIAATTRWSRSAGTTQPLSAAGPKRGCRPKPSGNTRRVAALREWHSRGETLLNRMASTS